jgi:hypothetical protein
MPIMIHTESLKQATKVFREASSKHNAYIWASDWIEGLVYIDGERGVSSTNDEPCLLVARKKGQIFPLYAQG